MYNFRSFLLASMFIMLAGCTSQENREIKKFVQTMIENLGPDVTEDEIRNAVTAEMKNLKLEFGDNTPKVIDDVVELIKDARAKCC